MINQKNTVVLTRPLKDSLAIRKELKKKGVVTLIEPMLEIEPLPLQARDVSLYDAFIVTSANALLTPLSSTALTKPIFCIGPQTAEAAGRKGFSDIKAASGEREDFLNQIAQIAPKGRILYLSGADASFSMKNRMPAGIQVETAVVYKAHKISGFSNTLLDRVEDGSLGLVTFFSKRTAEAFHDNVVKYHMQQSLRTIKALCISEGVLEYVQNYTWAETYISVKKNRQSMIDAIYNLHSSGVHEK